MKRSQERSLRRMTAGCILFAVSFLLLLSAKKIPGMADWYSVHIYQKLVNTIGSIWGIFPFSVSEIALYLLFTVVLVFIVRMAVKTVIKKEGRKVIFDYLSGLFLAGSVLFLIYVVNCGMNYERRSFSSSADIRTSEYSVEELIDVCRWLTEEVNAVSSQVKRDGNGVMVLKENEKSGAVEAMELLGRKFPELGGYYPQPKALLNPWLLSVQNLSGIYSPFTIEANYNGAMTPYNIPFTACHELSHLKGYMQEEEANFIAWLACRESERVDFKYSSNLMGWIYCMNVLYKVDYESYNELRSQLAPEAESDLNANRKFWAEYEGKIAEVSHKMNDTYLKANGQEEGVQSYDRMVDLIVAYGERSR